MYFFPSRQTKWYLFVETREDGNIVGAPLTTFALVNLGEKFAGLTGRNV